MSLRIAVGSIVAALALSGGISPAQAATKAGDTCKKIGQSKSVKSSKGELVCLKVAGQRTWVFVRSADTKGRAIKSARAWREPAELPNEGVIRHFARNSDAYVSERLAVAQQDRDQLAQQVAALTNQRSALESEISGLPSQVSQAQTVYQQAEAALDEPKRAYQSAASEAAVLDSQYTSAYNNYLAHISCVTLETFGFGGPCGYFDSAGYSSIKFRFEAAQARADSLWAAYSAAYSNYKAKYDEYKRLYDRRADASNELNATNAELASVNGALGAAEAHLASSHDTNGHLQNLRVTLARWDQASTKLQQLASKGLSGKWKSQYERMARLAGISQLHRADVVEAFANFRALTTDLPDPLPTSVPSEETEPVRSDAPSSGPATQYVGTG